ncbi:MAG: hypothetical protein R3228_01895 [Halioglobus sp.]|nr:hypothetical protein [Halioglobus sp.]
MILLLSGAGSRAQDAAPPSPEEAYHAEIAAIEARDGAYAGALSEHLLGLGLELKAQGRYAEAARLFKRGVHLARINDGLHSASQIPLLEGEIATHVAAGDFERADDRLRYLYRVQRRVLSSGEALTRALLRHASWQFTAYRLRLDTDPGWRLSYMREYYLQALTDIEQREGENSPSLQQPLMGLVKTGYLISDHLREMLRDSSQSDLPQYGDLTTLAGRNSISRLAMERSRNDSGIQTVLERIHDLEKGLDEAAQDGLGTARAEAMLGDWHLYHDRPRAAREAYDRAWAELAAAENARSAAAALFGDPVSLPDIEELRPLPSPVDPERADILLEFSVSDRGRAFDIKRLDDSEEFDSQARRLIRKLRKVKFRPRFEEGAPVSTTQIVRAYDVQ